MQGPLVSEAGQARPVHLFRLEMWKKQISALNSPSSAIRGKLLSLLEHFLFHLPKGDGGPMTYEAWQ